MRTKTLQELLATPYRGADFILEPQLLAPGGTMALYGMAGTGKSWLAIELAFAIATGQPWLGIYPTRKSSVLIVQAEQVERQYQRRLAKYVAHLNGKERPENLWFDNDLGLKLDGFVGLNTLIDDIKERKPQVVILDCLYQLIAGSVSSEPELKKFKDNIDEIRKLYNIAFILLHHPRKSYGDEGEDRGIEEMLTSSIFGNWLDTAIRVSGTDGSNQPVDVKLDFQKVKEAEQETPSIRLRFNRRTVRFNLH